MSLPINPYTAGDPVGKTLAFVGREDVLREVMRVLRHPTQNAITLFGQRRIGKTSVLQHLEKNLAKEGTYFPVFFDLMGKSGQPLPDILVDLARTISSGLKLTPPNLGENPRTNFQKTFIPQVLKSLPDKASLVLLLDEFDVLADPKSEKRTKKAFFEYLRGLRHLSPKHLQFVFVLGRNMDDLDIVAQSLFKDLPSKRVSLLDEKETERIIQLSTKNISLTWSSEAISRVWELTAGHPYLTQALCSQVWEDAYDLSDTPPTVEAEAVEEAIIGTLDRSENMFVWLWNGLGPAEKVVASALAQAGSVIVDENHLSNILSNAGVRILISELRDAPEILQKWDILTPANGGYRFSVELLRRWIEENKPLSRTQDELDHINPVADNYYQAALGTYLANQNVEEAIDPLRRALTLNPNHIRASELLGDILLLQGNLDEAQEVLERLANIAPANALPRLKQVYLQKADIETDNEKKLGWYQKILKVSPHDQDALKAQGDLATTIQQEKIQRALTDIKRLEQEQSYQEAYDLIRKIAAEYPESYAWGEDTERLKEKSFLAEKYRQALGAIQEGDRTQAKKLLAEVIALDPDYEEVSRYFYWAVNDQDPNALIPSQKNEAKKAAEANRNAQLIDYLQMSLAKPITQSMTTYVIGDDLFDEAFSIESQAGEFLGEFGVGISDTIGVGDPKKVSALEVWLFDVNDLITATKVLISEHAYNDPLIRQRLEPKGELIVVETGRKILLETKTLRLLVSISDFEYGQGPLPSESYFHRMTLELSVWSRNEQISPNKPARSAPSQKKKKQQAAKVNPNAQLIDYLPTPIAQSITTYVIGDDFFDESFSIDSKSGEFLGEYGVSIADTIGVGDPKKVGALEIWLFDKNDIRTAASILVSEYVNNSPEILERLKPKGEITLIKPQKQVVLKTTDLQLLVTVSELEYGQGPQPPNSFFARITLELAVWSGNENLMLNGKQKVWPKKAVQDSDQPSSGIRGFLEKILNKRQ